MEKRLSKKLKIRELTKNEKVLLTLLAIVILTWAAYRLVITPQTIKLEALIAKRIEYSQIINEMNQVLKNEDSIKKEWNSLHKEKEQIVSKYFPVIDQAQIIYLLNDLIEHEDVSVVDLNFTRPVYEDIGEFQVKSMDISIPYNGDYDGIIDIANAIKGSPRKILIDRISMDRDLGESLNGNMSLKVYSLEGIAHADKEVIYIDKVKNNSKITPFDKYDDFTMVNEETEDVEELEVESIINTDSGSSSNDNLYIEEILLDFESSNNYFLPSQALVKGNVLQSINSKSGKYSLRFEYNILAVEEENRAYVDISKNNIILKYPPNSIGLWIYSYGYSPVTLGIGLSGQMGEEEFIPLTEGIGWTGWKYLEVSPPSDLGIYPIKLDKLYVDMPKDREDFGVVLMDKLGVKYDRNLDEDGSDKSTSDYRFHVVVDGDTAEKISIKYYGTNIYKNEILKLNEIKLGGLLPIGKVLVLKRR